MTKHNLTLFPSLTQTTNGTPTSLTFDELARFLYVSVETPDKYAAPGFSPCELLDGQRNDASFAGTSLLALDVDQAGHQAVMDSLERIKKAGYAAILYTSWSFTGNLDAPIFPTRLILPFTYVLTDKAQYQAIRKAVIERFKIPADPDKCSGASHFFFRPSHRPGVTPIFHWFTGSSIYPASFYRKPQKPREVRSNTKPVAERRKTESTADELRTRIEQKLAWLKSDFSKRMPWRNNKVELLERLLAGEQLAEHGSREATTFRVIGMLTFSFPDAHADDILAIMRPSVQAMIDDGSKIRMDAVYQKILRNQAKYDEQASKAPGVTPARENDKPPAIPVVKKLDKTDTLAGMVQ